jgi:hypothetical protein
MAIDQAMAPYVGAESMEEAETALDRLLAEAAVDADVIAECYDDLATAAAEDEDYVTAARLERKAIDTGYDMPELARSMLASYQLCAGEREAGEALYARLREERPDDVELVIALGYAREEAGLRDEALAAFDDAVAVARLTGSVLNGIELRPERFEQIARESFVTAADVADVLALEGGLDYRSAHKVVGRAVRDLVEAGEPPSALTPARLAAAAEAAIGAPVELDEATLRAALDPAACAAARLQIGSSSEAAMGAMLAGLDTTLAANEAWSEAARERETSAEAALLARARKLASAA